MSENLPYISILILLPILGSAFILSFLNSSDRDSGMKAKVLGLWISFSNLVITIFMLAMFDYNHMGFQFLEDRSWIVGFNINYIVGVDFLAMTLILLTNILIPICILCSWSAVSVRGREFVVSFLMMQSFIIGAFSSLDLVLFYIFFEAILIPMYLIIGAWGGENRIYAAIKFFLFTLLGSVLLLVAIIYIYVTSGTTNLMVLYSILPEYSLEIQKWLWLAFFASFAVKVPMWPVHTWLPDAHVQAPTGGSVILAGILLKLGGYGFLRFSLSMLPDASLYYASFVYVLSAIAIVYTSLVAFAQRDMKKLIAYSSVAHMGYVTMGIFSFNPQGVNGAIYQMLSHGFVSAALFLVVGSLYDRLHTKEIAKYGGVGERMPSLAFVFMIFMLASVGLPGTSGFIGEFLSIAGIYFVNSFFGLLAASGMVLGAIYMLSLYRRVMFGEIKNQDILVLNDLSFREKLYFYSLGGAVIILGVYPAYVIDNLTPFVNYLTEISSMKVSTIMKWKLV